MPRASRRILRASRRCYTGEPPARTPLPADGLGHALRERPVLRSRLGMPVRSPVTTTVWRRHRAPIERAVQRLRNHGITIVLGPWSAVRVIRERWMDSASVQPFDAILARGNSDKGACWALTHEEELASHRPLDAHCREMLGRGHTAHLTRARRRGEHQQTTTPSVAHLAR